MSSGLLEGLVGVCHLVLLAADLLLIIEVLLILALYDVLMPNMMFINDANNL